MTTTLTLEELEQAGERDLGATDWVTLDQERINQFAEATGDHQWIHVDPEMAAQGPFGGTIAHGYLTLALAPALLAQVLPLEGYAMAVNYGLDRLRFPAPLPVGSTVRMRVALAAVDPIPGGATLSLTLTIERAAGGKPVCVADALYRVYE
jgi:acyl dehydratase